MSSPESIQHPETESQSQRYNIEDLKSVYGTGPHPIRGHDVGHHIGSPGFEQAATDCLLETARKIWKSPAEDPLRKEYSKHFSQQDDGQYKYLYDKALQAGVCGLDDSALKQLRQLIHDTIYSLLIAEDYYKRFRPTLDDCQKEAVTLEPLRDFLQQEIDQLKKMDPVEDDYKEIFVLLTVISMHAYDELVRRNRVR